MALGSFDSFIYLRFPMPNMHVQKAIWTERASDCQHEWLFFSLLVCDPVIPLCWACRRQPSHDPERDEACREHGWMDAYIHYRFETSWPLFVYRNNNNNSVWIIFVQP